MIIREDMAGGFVRIRSDQGLPIERLTDGAVFSVAVQKATSRVAYREQAPAEPVKAAPTRKKAANK